MGKGECLTLYRVVINDCVHSKGFPSANSVIFCIFLTGDDYFNRHFILVRSDAIRAYFHDTIILLVVS